jgi:hypothetical protein
MLRGYSLSNCRSTTRAEHEQEISRSGFDAVESSSTEMFNARWMWAVEEYFERAALL